MPNITFLQMSAAESPVSGLGGALLVALLAFALVAGIFIGFYLITLNAGKVKEKVYKGSVIPLTIAGIAIAGFVVRILMASFLDADVSALAALSDADMNTVYAGGVISFQPLTVYIVSFFGGMAGLFNVTGETSMRLFLTMPFMLADAGVFLLLYFIASRYLNKAVSIVLASMVYLNPAVFWNSAVGLHFNAITALLLVAVLYFMLKRNFAAMIFLYAAAIMTDTFALVFFPPVIILSIYYHVRAIQRARNQRVGFVPKKLWEDADLRPSLSIPLYLLGALAAMYIITLPLLEPLGFNPFSAFIFNFMILPIGNLTIFGNNSLSIYNIFNRNQLPLGSGFPNVFFGWAFTALIFGIVAFVYFSKKNRANLALASIYAAVTVALFYLGFNESTLVPILALFVLAYIIIQDKRIMQVFTVLSLAIFVNAATAYASGDMTSGGGLAVSIVASALAIMAHVYFTYVVLDIAMSGNRKQIRVFDTKPNFADAVVNWIK